MTFVILASFLVILCHCHQFMSSFLTQVLFIVCSNSQFVFFLVLPGVKLSCALCFSALKKISGLVAKSGLKRTFPDRESRIELERRRGDNMSNLRKNNVCSVVHILHDNAAIITRI